MSTKTLIVVVAIVAVVSVNAFDAEMEKKIKELIFEEAMKCMGPHKPSREDIASLRKHVVPDSEPAKCFLACILKSFGVIENGKHSKKNALAAAEPWLTTDEQREKVKGVIEKCDAEVAKDTNECDLAKDLVECNQRYKAELGIDMMDVEM